MSTPTCRICFETEEATNKLLTPCDCRGTVQFIHHDCIFKWITSTTNQRFRNYCMICGGKYSLPVIWRIEDDVSSSLYYTLFSNPIIQSVSLEFIFLHLSTRIVHTNNLYLMSFISYLLFNFAYLGTLLYKVKEKRIYILFSMDNLEGVSIHRTLLPLIFCCFVGMFIYPFVFGHMMLFFCAQIIPAHRYILEKMNEAAKNPLYRLRR
jgi:RING-variant domain